MVLLITYYQFLTFIFSFPIGLGKFLSIRLAGLAWNSIRVGGFILSYKDLYYYTFDRAHVLKKSNSKTCL